MSLPIYQRVAVTDAGDIIPGAEYTVINENTGVAQPIYSDRTGATLLTPPYFADSAGTIQFFIAQGTTFRVAASGGVGTYTDRYVYGVAEAVLVQADGDVEVLSGNLLVGATSEANWQTVAGFRARPSGSTTITRSAAPALYVNRLSSDGNIQEFLKDGTTVGSIGTISSDLTIGTGDAGLRFNNPYGELLPHNVSTNSGTDATVTLGSGAVRFKNLYLSGGIYLGGTAAANNLDDYEEGTWTPVLSRGGTPATLSFGTSATYTKVGRLVTLSVYINGISNFPTTGGNAVITGLPFAASGWHTGNIAYGSATNCSNTTWVVDGSIGYFLTTDNVNFVNSSINLNQGMFTITYQTA